MESSGGSSKEFLTLAKALESDTEWHRTVTNATYAIAMSSRGAPLKGHSGAPQWPINPQQKTGPAFPCSHCGTSIVNYNKHIMTFCATFKERYNWRKSNLVNYCDSLLDHNKFKVFCDLPDRRTSSGGTIPLELLPASDDGTGEVFHTNLKPDLVILDRQTNHVHIFVITIADESEMPEAKNKVLEEYYCLVESMSENDPNLSFHTIEIGAFTGQISEGTKFALWEIYKLSKCSIPVNVFIDNIVLLTKLGSFVIFKWRKERRWTRKSNFLHPANLALKKKGFVRGYLKPMGKVVGLVASVVGLILLLHIGYTMSGWLWEQMTLKVMIFIYVTIMILFLALFRP